MKIVEGAADDDIAAIVGSGHARPLGPVDIDGGLLAPAAVSAVTLVKAVMFGFERHKTDDLNLAAIEGCRIRGEARRIDLRRPNNSGSTG